jgi:hypothetical protein
VTVFTAVGVMVMMQIQKKEAQRNADIKERKGAAN